MRYLERRKVKKGLSTRNFAAPVEHLLDTFLDSGREGGEYGVFEPIVTRETKGVSPKPSPEGLWFIAKIWGLGEDEVGSIGNGMGGERGEVDPLVMARKIGEGLIMVGDSVDDMRAGRRAGAATVLLVNDENGELEAGEDVDLGVRRLDELVGVLEKGFEGRS